MLKRKTSKSQILRGVNSKVGKVTKYGMSEWGERKELPQVWEEPALIWASAGRSQT